MPRALQPRRRVRLEAAHQQSADFFLEVDVAIGIAQHRQLAMNAVDAVGHDVVVLAGEERHRDVDLARHFARPLAAAQHDDFSIDAAVVAGLIAPGQTGNAFHAGRRSHLEPARSYVFENLHAAIARPFGKRERQIGRVRLAVSGQPHRSVQIAGCHDRVQLPSVCHRDDVALDTVCARHRRGAFQLNHPIRGARHSERSALLPAST